MWLGRLLFCFHNDVKQHFLKFVWLFLKLTRKEIKNKFVSKMWFIHLSFFGSLQISLSNDGIIGIRENDIW